MLCSRPLEVHRRQFSPATRCQAAFGKQRVVKVAASKQLLDSLAERVPNPILKAAIKEPVAFAGGLFAGALGLDIQDEPLKSWVERTKSEAGIRPPTPPQQLSPSSSPSQQQ